jgi:hypothetical protein
MAPGSRIIFLRMDGMDLHIHQGTEMAAETTYMVRGIWPFPADMLKKDGSRAATPADQAIIDSLMQEYAPDRSAFEPVEITLIGPNKPNTARWESFKWEVPGDEMHSLIKADRARQTAEKAMLAGALAKLDADERTLVERLIGARRH